MLKSTVLAVAAGAFAALFAFNASAMPLAPVTPQAGVANGLILVADGCGRGRHFSKRRQSCVSDEPVVIIRHDCPRGTHYSERRGACIENERIIRVDCPRGTHYSERRRACVENERIIRVECPRGTHFSERRQACVDNPSPAAAAVGAVLHAITKDKDHDKNHKGNH
jgi:hypothetical protein